jgi:hypothetical protein
MTSFELAQTLARLGAVTASAVDSGGSVTVAFDGELLNRPSDPGGERAVKEALLVKYYGVYAPPLDDVDKDDVAKGELLVYKLVRPSTVTAELLPPDQVPRPVDAGAGKQPGFYRYPYTELDQEGTWHWIVQATDDLNRTSTIDRTFQVDFTLSALRVPRSVPRSAGVTVRFTLSRPARVALRIETRLGTIVKTFPARALSDGEQSLQWDAHLSKKTKAFPGSYVARVIATSEIGTMDLAAPFTLRK